MTDQEFFERLEQYRKTHNFEWQEIAAALKVSRATISNWKNGGKIADKNRRGIMILTTEIDYPAGCFLPRCPAGPPVDRLTQYLLEAWQAMNGEEKARVIALIEEMREKKSAISPAEDKLQ